MSLNAAFQYLLAVLVKYDSNWGPVAGFRGPSLNRRSDTHYFHTSTIHSLHIAGT